MRDADLEELVKYLTEKAGIGQVWNVRTLRDSQLYSPSGRISGYRVHVVFDTHFRFASSVAYPYLLRNYRKWAEGPIAVVDQVTRRDAVCLEDNVEVAIYTSFWIDRE